VLLAGGAFVLYNAVSVTSTTLTTSIRSAANNKAIVTGSLRIFGGTNNASPSGTPVAGRVVFKPTRGVARALKVGRSGEFKIVLPGGTYKGYGGPPAWGNECLVNDGRPFKIVAGHSFKVVVACIAA
jgi:hypothetical protein